MDALLTSLLEQCEDYGASDVHLAAEMAPRFRLRGTLVEKGGYRPFDQETVDRLAMELGLLTLPPGSPDGTERIRRTLLAEGSLDGALTSPGGVRYRFNVFREGGRHAVALRRLDSTFRSFDELGLPPMLETFCDVTDGLFIVTGPTGSGKSTTLATMIDRINRTRNAHIVTIEDPVEFVHRSDRCIVNQRQIGRDAPSFNNALVAALRQDPDVILVGEIRDLETIRTALQAAETGHLVLTTLHAGDCAGAIERLVGVFPADEQASVRQQLALVLRGIFTQHLVRRADGDGRVPVCELLVNNPAISNFIVTGRSQQVYSAMEVGGPYGMCTIDQSLNALLDAGLITAETACALSKNPQQYR